MTRTDLPVIRRAGLDESGAVADLLIRVREQNQTTIPALAHTADEVRAWMAQVVLVQPRNAVWVAESAGSLVAVMVLAQPDWLEQLYVDAAHAGQGLGARLVELARRELGGQVQLWTFQSNLGARRFYERHGFVAVETTDGDNEEKAPDVRYVSTSTGLGSGI